MADGPWTQYQKAPAIGQEEGPWTEFQRAKPAPAAPTQPASWGDTALDVAKAIPRGVRQGYESLAGLGGDVYNLEVSGAGKLAKLLGASPETLAEIEATRGQRSSFLPTSQDVREKMTDPLLGEAGKPTTKWGEVAQTGASMIPSMGRTSFTRAVVAPTVGMEVGQEIGKRYGHEDAGRLIGGGIGALVPGGFTKGVTRKVTPERSAQVRTLADEGVELTGGQASGSKAMQYLEAGPFEGKAAGIAEQQGEQLSRANLRRAGIDAYRATPEVMAAAQERFGHEYDSLIAQNNGIHLDPTLEHELLDNVTSYERLKGQAAAPAVNQYFGRISDAAQANGGVIPPDVFQSIRSDISKDLGRLRGGQGNAETISALRQFQDSLYGSLERNGQPEVAAASRELNNRYRNFKTIEKAMLGAGEDTSRGLITPGKMRTAVEGSDKVGYVQGRGDFNDLARAAEGTMKPLPQSGSMARAAPYVVATALGGAGTQIMNGQPLAAAATLGATALPWAGSKLLTSRPVRSSIVREAAGQPLPLLDPITAALIARQQEGRQ